VAPRVGERGVGGAAAAEFGIHLNDVADIHYQQKGRPALGCRQGTGIAFGLGAGAQQGVVEALGAAGGLELFGFQYKSGHGGSSRCGRRFWNRCHG